MAEVDEDCTAHAHSLQWRDKSQSVSAMCMETALIPANHSMCLCGVLLG
jgi:hypothetical protein